MASGTRHPWVPTASSGGQKRTTVVVSRFVLDGAPVTVRYGAGHRPRGPRCASGAEQELARVRLSADLVELTCFETAA